MKFEWDQHNLAKITARGFTPEMLEAIVSDPNLDIVRQERPSETEPRWLTIGYSADRRIVVVWTVRGDAVRIVTAWHESRPRKRT